MKVWINNYGEVAWARANGRRIWTEYLVDGCCCNYTNLSGIWMILE